MEESIITLSKHITHSTKGSGPMGVGSSLFRFKVTDAIINHLGRRVKVSLNLNDARFPCIVITKFGQLDHGTPNIISGKLLRIPSKLIDEWNDLGDYNVEFGVESIVLTKVKNGN